MEKSVMSMNKVQLNNYILYQIRLFQEHKMADEVPESEIELVKYRTGLDIEKFENKKVGELKTLLDKLNKGDTNIYNEVIEYGEKLDKEIETVLELTTEKGLKN